MEVCDLWGLFFDSRFILTHLFTFMCSLQLCSIPCNHFGKPLNVYSIAIYGVAFFIALFRLKIHHVCCTYFSKNVKMMPSKPNSSFRNICYFFCSWLLDPFGVTGSMLEPIPATYGPSISLQIYFIEECGSDYQLGLILRSCYKSAATDLLKHCFPLLYTQQFPSFLCY